MKLIIKLAALAYMYLCVGGVWGQTFPYTDPFATPGPLSAFWTQTSAVGFSALSVASAGKVEPLPSSQGLAIFTSGSITTPSIQASVNYNSGNFSGLCLVSVAGTGACYYPVIGQIRAISNGTDAGAFCHGSVIPASGDTIQIGTISGGNTVVIDWTTSTVVCSSGSFGSGLLPAMLVDNRAVVGDYIGPATVNNANVAPPILPPTFSNPGQAWNLGFNLSLIPAAAGATSCYTLDGATPAATTPGTCDSDGHTQTFTSAFSINGNVTVKAIATKTGSSNSGIVSASYTFSPFYYPSGTYHFHPTVNLFTNQGDSHIYTTDGSTPTADGSCNAIHGTLGSSVTVASSETVKYIGCSGGVTGGVQTAAYVIGSPVTYYVVGSGSSLTGGSRYDATYNPTGLCNGTAYANPVGVTPNQNCAFNDIRLLWTTGGSGSTTNPAAGAPLWGFIGYGGDTYDIDCPNDCRIGPSLPDGTNIGLQANAKSSGAPTPPSGGLGTAIPPIDGSSACSVSGNACTTIRGHNYASCTADASKAHINGGYGINFVSNLYGVNYATVECLHIERHSECMRNTGPLTASNLGITAWSITGNVVTFTTSPATWVALTDGQYQLTGFPSATFFNGVTVTVLPGATTTQFQANFTHANGSGTETGTASQVCNTSTPFLSDSADSAFQTSNTTTNILFQDVAIQGLPVAALVGPIGNGIQMERVRMSGTALASWIFDDGFATPNEETASLVVDNTIAEWAGCIHEYPTIDATPYKQCADDNFAGFGDAWSAQGTGAGGTTSVLAMTMTNSITRYATKDGFGMNHIQSGNLPGIKALVLDNDQWIGNQGNQIKAATSIGATVEVTNNTIVGNCHRLQAPFPGAPVGYNRWLGDPCRAPTGTAIALADSSTVLFNNNSITGYVTPTVLIGPSATQDDGAASSVFTVKNNLAIGYIDTGYTTAYPTMFNYTAGFAGTTVRANNLLFRQQISCPTGNPGEICVDPILVGEPSDPITESQLDNFNFNLTSSSPAILAGTTPCPANDQAGSPQTSPCTIGALVSATPSTVFTPTFSPIAGTYVGTQNIIISTLTSGATICYTTDGSTPTAVTPGTCTHGTTYASPVAVSVSETLNAIGTKSAFTNSSVGSAAYVINGAATPTFSPSAGTYVGTQTVTLSTSTSSCIGNIVWNTTNAQTGGNLIGTSTTNPVTVSTTETVYAQVQGCSGVTNSAIGSAAYTINAPPVPQVTIPGTVTLTGSSTI